MRILFSVLRYQLITDEFMNIGILFHNLDTDERRLETINRWKRLKGFDDELDIKLLKILIDGIKEEIQNTFFNNKVVFDIYEYHRRYINELRFTEVYEAETTNFEKYIEFSKKNFLRYDYEKKERPNKEQQIKYMKELMKSNSIKYNSKSIKGKHCENVNFDYIIDQYAFKVFSFEDKQLNNLIQSAKAWAFTANEMKKKYKTIFLYDKDLEDQKFKIIIDILSESAYKILKYDEGLDLILSLSKNSNLKEL